MGEPRIGVGHPHAILEYRERQFWPYVIQWECTCGNGGTEADAFWAGAAWGAHVERWKAKAPRGHLGEPIWRSPLECRCQVCQDALLPDLKRCLEIHTGTPQIRDEHNKPITVPGVRVEAVPETVTVKPIGGSEHG